MVAARNFSEWFAFYGGEELGIGRDNAAVVWEAATKAAEALNPSHNTASLILPSWFDLTKDIKFASIEALYAAKEIYSRIAACQHQA